MPSDKRKNEPTFLSLLSERKLSSLKNKLTADKNNPCPIQTLNQLLEQPMAMAKTNVSLRSLRSKPLNRTTQPISQPDSTEKSNSAIQKYNNSGETVNVSISRTVSESNQCVNDNPNSNDVFLMPTTRAPRALAQDSKYWIELIRKKALLAWCTLDKEKSRKFFHLLILYVLDRIEESESSQIRNDVLDRDRQLVSEWFHKLVSSESNVVTSSNGVPGLGFQDMDNMTSVSGYVNPHHATYQAPFANQNSRLSDYRGPVLQDYMRNHYGRTYDQTSAASEVGSSYDVENQFRYQGLATATNSLLSGSRLPTLPVFVSRSSMSCNGGSVVGSNYLPRTDSIGYQHSSFMQNKPLTMGYTSRAMPMRPEPPAQMHASFHRPRPLHSDVYSNTSTIPNSSNYPYAVQNMRGRGAYDDYENRDTASTLEPMQGSRVLKRSAWDTVTQHIDHDRIDSLRNIHNPMAPRNPLRTSSFQNLTLRNGTQKDSMLNLTSQRYFIRDKGIDNATVPGEKEKRVEPHCSSREQPQGRAYQPTPLPKATRAIPALVTPARGVNPSENAIVTRSGRLVRAPQHFWSSNMSISAASNTSNNRGRGIKRKRNSQK